MRQLAGPPAPAGLEALGVEVDMPEELLRAALDPVQNVERAALSEAPVLHVWLK